MNIYQETYALAKNLFDNTPVDEMNHIDEKEAKRLLKEFEIDYIIPADLVSEYNYLVDEYIEK